MEPSVQTDRVAEYLAEVRPYLDDLDPAERAEVLDELTDALREVAAEDDRPLREALGPPADYVAAYRASAGLEARPAQGLRARLASLDASFEARLRAQPWWPQVEALARLLRPSWWTMRGGVLAVLVGWFFFGYPRAVIASVAGLLFVAAAVAASMAIRDGRHLGRGWRRVLLVANVVTVLGALTVVSEIGYVGDASDWDSGYEAGFNDGSTSQMGQMVKPNGAPVTNIYPYTRDGEPLDDVLLFDGAGKPLRLIGEDETIVTAANRDFEITYQRDADGQPITNLYPLQQSVIEYDDAGEERRRPQTAPAIVLPPSVRADPTEAPASEAAAAATPAPAMRPQE